MVDKNQLKKTIITKTQKHQQIRERSKCHPERSHDAVYRDGVKDLVEGGLSI